MKVFVVVVAATVAAVVLGACGGSSGDDGQASDDGSVTVYSSLPLQGPAKPLSDSVVNGIKLALEQADGRAGRFDVKYKSLDDSTAVAGNWDPAQVSANARRVTQDDGAVAYIGELNSGATVVSLPILNEASILQVSPSNTYIGLTRSEGAASGEPEKYYPTGKRTFARPIPADHIMAKAQVAYQREQGCTKLYVTSDGEVGGSGQADLVAAAAPPQGIKVLDKVEIDPKAPNYRALAAAIKSSGADCVFFGGVTANNAVQLWRDIHIQVPSVKLFGTDGVAEDSFAKDIGAAGPVTFITNATLDPASYPPAGREFFKQYEQKFGTAPQAYAIYGYESMASILAAIEAAGKKGADPAAVVSAYFGTRDRRSVLGTYSIDPSGDTTLRQFGAFRVKDDRVVFDHAIDSGS